MKVIQFKKSGQYTGNCDEVTKALGGTVIYTGQCGSKGIQKTYERGDQCLPLQFSDWIIDINGVVLILSEDQYRALKSVVITEPLVISKQIDDAIKKNIENEQRQGGQFHRLDKVKVEWGT